MKISRTTILLTALLASSAVSYSVNATEMPSPATNCKMSGQMCMDKELGSLERAVNGKPVQVVEGQNVRARFFSSETELPALETRITILPEEEPHWSYVLAKAINDQHPDLQAGFLPGKWRGHSRATAT